MKKSICISVTALLFNAAAQADEVPPAACDAAAATPGAPSAMPAALSAMGLENEAHMPRDGNINTFLDAYPRMAYTADTRARLLAVFGDAHPVSIVRVPGAQDRLHYRITLPPHAYHDPCGSTIEWDALSLALKSDRAGHRVEIGGAWPALVIDGGTVRATLRDMRLDIAQARAADGLWYGNQHVRIDSMVFDHVGSLSAAVNATGSADDDGQHAKIEVDGGVTAIRAPESQPDRTIVVEGVDIRFDMKRHGRFADIGYGSSIGRVSAGGEQVERVNFALRALHLDPATLLRFKNDLQHAHRDGETPMEHAMTTMAVLGTFWRKVAVQGVQLVFDDISASYRGHTAAITGRIGFEKLVDKDFDGVGAALKKLVAHFDVHVPVALVEEVSRIVVGQQLEATLHQAPAQADVDRGAREMAQGMIARMSGDGYVRNDGGELRSAIDVRDGRLYVNGREVSAAALMPAAQALVPPHAPATSGGAPQK